MNRIDLNTSIPSFCADYVPSSIRVRIENILYKNVGLKSVREVCEMWESDLFKFRSWGKRSQMALKEALSECGLHLSMSDKELTDYERYWLAEKARDVRSDAIDWEQRRWELVKELFAQAKSEYKWMEPQPQDIIEKADKLLEEYKKSLNTEK